VAIWGVVVILGVAYLGRKPPPSQGQVWICRSDYHIAKIPYEPGMRVSDAVARGRKLLGERGREDVVLYRWKPWLPERVADSIVAGMQGFFFALDMHQSSDTLWRWWSGIVPRQFEWLEVARNEMAQNRLVESGAIIVLRSAR
jgi:hypothetical protein